MLGLQVWLCLVANGQCKKCSASSPGCLKCNDLGSCEECDLGFYLKSVLHVMNRKDACYVKAIDHVYHVEMVITLKMASVGNANPGVCVVLFRM